jgi:smad nuclear-interacting protein 1
MSRRTSRWGGRDNEQQQRQQAVSDDDALKALLFSAESRTREREGKTANSSSTQGGRDGGGGGKGRVNGNGNGNNNRGNRGGSGRGGNNHNNSNNRDKKDEVSYYGPGGNSNNGDDNDRKRKRPLRQDQNGPRRVEDDDDKSKEKGTTTSADKEGDDDEESRPPPEYKPNFGLSGALAKDTDSGNVYKGIVLKFKEPPEARAPNTLWRLYVFKPQQNKKDDADLIETLHISKQSAYLFGRNTDIADIPLLHPSLSSQHAVLQYRAMSVSSTSSSSLYNGGSSGGPRLSCQPYIMDLESTNGTFLNGVRIDAARYYQLKKGDVLTFGASTREYILLTENTTSAK